MAVSTRKTSKDEALTAMVVAALALLPAVAEAATAEPFFEATGSLTTLRSRAMAAPLPGGKVLVVGGSHFDDPKAHEASGLAGAEVYDAATGGFTATGSMAVSRIDAAIAPLPGGRVLVAGGLQAPQASKPWSSAEIYDPATGAFTATGSMAIGRWSPTAAPLPDGRVLVMGGGNVGYDPATETHTATFASAEIYDPTTGKFTPTGSMSVARVGAGATLLPSGKVLVAGGSWLASAELYDPETGDFTDTGSLTQAMNGPAVTLADGFGLVFGGVAPGQVELDGYDPATGAFAPLPVAPARGGVAVAPLPGGRVLVAGGTSGGGNASSISAAAQVFVSAPSAQSPGLDFGEVPAAETSGPRALTVTNLGAQDLEVEAAALTGPDAADFEIVADGCTGETLAFEASCELRISVTPSSSEPLGAALELTDNAPSGPDSFPLVANGAEAPAAPAGSAPVGSGATGDSATGGSATPGGSEAAGEVMSSAEEDGWEAASASHGTPAASASRTAALPKRNRLCRSAKRHGARHATPRCARPGKVRHPADRPRS